MKGTDRRDEDRQKQVPTGGGGEERQNHNRKKNEKDTKRGQVLSEQSYQETKDKQAITQENH